jgi:hypothetical protein
MSTLDGLRCRMLEVGTSRCERRLNGTEHLFSLTRDVASPNHLPSGGDCLLSSDVHGCE